MCGIIGYNGKGNAAEILLSGLENLEYRGYDSAGIALVTEQFKNSLNPQLVIKKVKGRVLELKKEISKEENKENSEAINNSTFGIGHTRWATHGVPCTENAHPHTDCRGKIAVIHNGIIENFLEIKNRLAGHCFKSQTDTEVIAHLIEDYYSKTNDLKKAVQLAVKDLIGTYAICVIHPGTKEIVAARNGSPLVAGIGENENFVASDVMAFIAHTKNVAYLEDFETAVIKENSIDFFDKDNNPIKKEIRKINWDFEQAQKQGYKHFMLKEIHEQPKVISDTLNASLGNFKLKPKGKIFVTACGTASHAAIIGKYLIEKICRIPVEFDAASEFRYKEPLISENDLLIAVSQSGETADTLAALRIAKEKGAKTLGIINVVDSTIARESGNVIYTKAGTEIGVASTKAFVSQLVVFYKIAERLSGVKLNLDTVPALVSRILDKKEEIYEIAKKYYKVHNFIYIGRNLNYPIALEGALKLKEISYIHAEGYASGEMKHGPIALVTDEVPTVAIAPRDSVYPKMVSNIQEVRARKGKVIAVATEGDEDIKKHCDDALFVPKVDELLYPLLTVVPLQLLAYYIADLKHCDVDKPRNLAKSVTVE